MAGFPILAQGGAPATSDSISKHDANALISRLKSSAPAVNPQTPDVRKDPTTERLQNANTVRVGIEKLLTTINESEALLKTIVETMHSVAKQIVAEVEPQEILANVTTLLSRATAPAPQGPPMGQSAGMPGLPKPPQGGVPSPPPVPVSPGILPGQQ